MDLKQIFPNRILVQGRGLAGSKIALVGDFPESKDEITQQPMSGARGYALKQILHNAGVNTSLCYMTYVLKERPYRDDASLFLQVSKKNAIESVSFKTYKEYLKNELTQVAPNIVITYGDMALYTLTGQTSSMKYRGSILESTLIPGLKVIPTLDPMSAIRKYIFKSYIQFDIMRAVKESYSPDIRYTHREYHLAPTFGDAIRYLRECQELDMVPFDIEVINGEMSCISFAKSFQDAMTIPFVQAGGHYFNPDQELELMLEVAKILEDPLIMSVGQNVTFDATFLFRRYGIKSKNLHDTMVAMAICYPEFDKNLGFITSIYTDIPYYKDDGKSMFAKGGTIRDREFWLYCAKDSIVLAEALPKLLGELEKTGNLITYQKQIELLEILLFMTEKGIAMAHDKMREMSVEVEKDIVAIRKEINDVVGYEINVASPKQVANHFYNIKKIKPYTKMGRPTTDEKALKQLSAKGFREATLMLRARDRAKLASTYLNMKLDDDKRLRCSMNPVGTKFGRLSSSKTIFGTGANMQNQPHIMKKFMLVDDGYVGFNVDASQAENRVVAYIAPEPKMIEAFESKADIHRRTAGYIFELPESEVSDEKGSTSIGGGRYSQRDIGKRSNHSLNYGISARQFALIFELQLKEAEFIINRYHQVYPGVRQMHEWIRNELQLNRTLTNLFGRKMTFRGRYDDQMFKAAYSFIPQSTVADMINRHALIPLYHDQETYEHVWMLNQVHDSVVFQMPLSVGWDTIRQTLSELRSSLEQPLQFRNREFVIPCDIEMAVGNFKNSTKVKTLDNKTLHETYTHLLSINPEITEADYDLPEEEDTTEL